MSVWKTLLQLFLFYGLCFVYGFFILIRLAFRLLFNGWTTLDVKPRPNPPNCLNDSNLGRHNYVKLKEVKLHYVEAGDRDKPLLLCLHGFPEFWYSWRHQLQEFRKDFWVVAVDMRGYGDSDKPSGVGSYAIDKLVGDIEQLVPALGHSSCIVMAHDWGAIVAWHFAIKFPEMVDRLIVMNGPHPAAFSVHILSCFRQFFKSWYIFFFQIPYLPEIFCRSNDVGLIDGAFLGHPKGKLTFCEHDIEAYKYTFGSKGALTGPLNYYRNIRKALMSETRPKEENPKVKVPVLIIWGTDDKALCKELAQLSSDYCEQCTVRMVKGASHWVQQDSPRIVNQHVHEFLRVLKTNEIASLDTSPGLVGRVRNHLVSSVSSSAMKLSKMPVIYPVIGLYQANSWVAGLNRKLL